MKRLGIFGGTFDPIHNGHLALADAAKKEFALDEIIFVPSAQPPHKVGEKITDSEHRFNMVNLAIQGIKSYSLSRIELDRQGISYAVETFAQLIEKHKDSKLFYIMGLDSLNEILTWKKPLELFKMCEFIVGTRPGTKMRTFKRMVKFPPLEKEVDKIHLLELSENIASSEIRKKLKAKEEVKELPETVENYIKEHKLYR